MRGRVRNFILFAFALAFIVQLAVVFLYFPSSSINSGLLLDESTFPVSPPRVVRMTHSALSALASGYPQSNRQAINTLVAKQIAPEINSTIEVQHPSPLSIAVSDAPEKQALAPSILGQKYDLVRTRLFIKPVPILPLYNRRVMRWVCESQSVCRSSELTPSLVAEALTISCAL
jgi:hypothetical protein